MKIDLAELQTRHGVSTERLAAAINRPHTVVEDWQTGPNSAPTYIALTIDAVSRDMLPATDDVMIAHDLKKLIGIGSSVERYWKTTLQFPQAARLAVQAALLPGEPIGPYDLELLRRLNEATHYRASSGWRARPVLGKSYPTVRRDTPSRLIRAGLVAIASNPSRLVVTDKGRGKIYDR